MKERSVESYKRLIVGCAVVILIVTISLIVFLLWPSDGQGEKLPQDVEVQGQGEETTFTPVLGGEGQSESEELSQDGESQNLNSNDEQLAEQGTEESGQAETSQNTIIDSGEKLVYLTFDDGVSSNTGNILDFLKEEGVPATFFINTSGKYATDEIIKRMDDEGHGVGVLTSSGWNYREIYESVSTYFRDFDEGSERLTEVLGEKPTIFRFPGGSVNSFNRNISSALTEEMGVRGFTYFDWNVCGEDSSYYTDKSTIVKNATKLPSNRNNCVILLHDNGNPNMVPALEEIIDFYEDNGYEFKVLDESSTPVQF